MKVICIDDYDLAGRKVKLTPGKIYNVDSNKNGYLFDKDKGAWVVTNDAGIQRWYYKDVLMPLEKWREIRIKELGIS
jgi:hypothetical protein